jgi:signal transduction histidine kinase
LASEVTDAGLPVSLSVSDEARELPPGVELAAYRIVQEALTNARKHARAHEATVELQVDRGVLQVVVTDNGTGPPKNGGKGHGLIGMRERVAVYGGSLEAGLVPEGGFRVAAKLPFDDEVAS